MAKDVLEVDGIVKEALPNAMFKVELEGLGKEVLCHIPTNEPLKEGDIVGYDVGVE